MDDIKSKLHYLLSNKKHFGQLLMMTNKNIMLFQKKKNYDLPGFYFYVHMQL